MLVQLGNVWNFKGFLDQKILIVTQAVSISPILNKIDIFLGGAWRHRRGQTEDQNTFAPVCLVLISEPSSRGKEEFLLLNQALVMQWS